MSDDAKVQKDAEESLNLMFGGTDWYDALSEETGQGDLFIPADKNRRKIATSDAVTRFMIGKMKKVFNGVVLDQWLPLGRQGGHWYSLIFACSNDSKAARELAGRVAKDIMRRK